MFNTILPDLNGKSILVTGGTGSFGKAFIKRVLADWKPKRLIVFSRDELKQWEMQQDLSQEKYPAIEPIAPKGGIMYFYSGIGHVIIPSVSGTGGDVRIYGR